jgi:hypothetical protein
MIFTLNIPKTRSEKDAEYLSTGWRRLKEPVTVVQAILLSIPFMAINLSVGYVFLSGLLGYDMTTFFPDNGRFTVAINLIDVLLIAGFIVLHECFHLVLIPNFWRSKRTFVGLTFFGGFVFTEEEIEKTRFLLITLFPFMALSFFFPVFCYCVNCLSHFIVTLALINAICSCVDCLTFCLVLFQVQGTCKLVQNGTKTYYKVIV